MIIQDTSNHRKHQYNRYDDILEDYIAPNKRNVTATELHLYKINRAILRKQRNNHAKRLAKWRKHQK